MSFMAVMGLAAFFEYWNRPKPEREYRIESRKIYYARKFYQIALASILTTLIAGSFSSIPAAYHFGRLAPYGVLANGLAIPVISLAVMPFAVLSVVLMPLGLEGWPLAVLGKGLEMVTSYFRSRGGVARSPTRHSPSAADECNHFGASELQFYACLAGRPNMPAAFFCSLGFVMAQFNSISRHFD